MNFISRIIEPQRLLLAWQSSNPEERLRRIIGDLVKIDENIIVLNYFKQSDDCKGALALGCIGYPSFPISKQDSYSDGVSETFMRRLPPRTRSDFNEYLENLRIKDSNISDFALLGYSEAKLPSDGFSLIHIFEDVVGPFEFLSEVAGFRYYEGMKMEIPLGTKVSFEIEKDNPYDPNAIKVLVNNMKIGYINRAFKERFASWILSNSVEAVIERKNGEPNNPRVILFVQVK